MTTLREAAQQALNALEHIMNYSSPHGLATVASTLRKALARQIVASDCSDSYQPEPLCTAAMFDDSFLAKSGLSPDTKLYTHPPQRKPLTDEALNKIIGEVIGWNSAYGPEESFARAIERAHGIGGKE